MPNKARGEEKKIIALTTDFGAEDSYVGQVKGVILNLFPAANIQDITHQIQPYDVRTGARVLLDVVAVFPDNTIHVAVVDPGVGSKRKSIIVEVILKESEKRCILLGPDNGIFSLVIAAAKDIKAWEIERSALPKISSAKTFDGRDVFAQAAALVAKGEPIENIAKPIGAENLEIFAEPKFFELESGEVEGEIIYFDHFGNAQTNIPGYLVLRDGAEKKLEIKQTKTLLNYFANFLQAERGKYGYLVNSRGYIEIFAFMSSARHELRLQSGDKVRLSLPDRTD